MHQGWLRSVGKYAQSDEMFQFIVTYLPYQNGDENVSLER